jgi:hypothetical protein
MALRKKPIIKKRTRKQRGGSAPKCQCTSDCNRQIVKGEVFCSYHKQNGCPIKPELSGYEPDYEPDLYNGDKNVQYSHNCFAYAMDVRDPSRIKICREKKNCSTPQPGRKKGHNEFSGKMGKTCADILSRTMADVPTAYITNFTNKCDKGFSKIGAVVDEDNDYHYYRQDSNGLWSHKPGGRPVKNTDSNNAKIYRPDLAGREYPPEYNGNSGLNYNSFCSYMCVPRKGVEGVNPIQIAGKRTKKRRSYL